MRFWTAHKVEISIFVLALLVRLVYLGAAIHYNGGDLVSAVQGADGYFAVAQNIIDGHGFSDSTVPPYLPYSFRPPLQHYFIAGSYFLFGGFAGAILFELLLGSLLPLLAMRVVSYLFSRRIVVITGILLALEPVAILFSGLFYSETLFMFFFFISLLYLFKYLKGSQIRYLLYSACYMGFATLTRPTSEYVPILIAGILLWEGRKIIFTRVVAGHVALYLTASFLVLAPWFWRNKILFGEMALSPQIGVNLYANVVPSVLSIENGTSYAIEQQKLLQTGVKGPNGTAIGEDKGYTQIALGILLQHPKVFFWSSMNTLLAFFTHDGMFDVLKHIGLRPDVLLGQPALFLLLSNPAKLFGIIGYYLTKPAILILFARIIWSLVTVLFFIGAWRYLKREGVTPYALIAIVNVLYFAVITLSLGLTINSRYRLPVEFLIIPFALYGLLYCKTLWHHYQS